MTDDKAREARYTKAIADAYDSAHPFGRAVLPLVDAEVEAATRELRAEVDEYAALCDRQASLLTRTINVLRGDPPPLTSWSHHDVPEQAQDVIHRAQAAEAEAAKQARWVDEVKVGRDAWALRGIKAEAERDQLRAAMTALAESLQNHRGSFDMDRDVALNGIQNRVTDLLAQIEAADTQPESGEGR